MKNENLTNEQKKVRELRKAFRLIYSDIQKEYFTLGAHLNDLNGEIASLYNDECDEKTVNEYFVDVSARLFGAQVRTQRLLTLLEKIDKLADKA